MKKHNEGYVLAMVMAVIAVLAVVASAMLAVGLRNVQTQQAAIERMQKKYAAEGKLEITLAELEDIKTQTFDGELNADTIENKITSILNRNINILEASGNWTCLEDTINNKTIRFTSPIYTLQTKTQKEGETATVCSLVLTGVSEAVGVDGFKITITGVEFKSYESLSEVSTEATTTKPTEGGAAE